MKCLYIDGSAGAAGDMLLAALADLGCELSGLIALLEPAIGAPLSVTTESVAVNGIAARRLRVEITESHSHRRLSDILNLLSQIPVSDTVRRQTEAAFRRLAEAEGRIHGADAETVHFHEVGANDAILDIVGFYWGLEQLGVMKVFAAPLTLGAGVGRSAHGAIHYPAPAVLEILKGHPVRMAGEIGETTTPTGAAILAGFAEFTEDVTLTAERTGYGAGIRDLPDRPNVVRATLGIVSDTFTSDRLWMAASDIDNTRPEVFEWLVERLLSAGAVDVTRVDLTMKKGRRGTRIEALCKAEDRATIAGIILKETASLGVRWTEVTRSKLPRRIETLATEWGPMRVKVAVLPDGSLRGVPEYDDCRRVAAEHGVPLLKVIESVSRRFSDTHDRRENDNA